jgi:hypothetical protein
LRLAINAFDSADLEAAERKIWKSGMGAIFLSHSNKDNAAAAEIKARLDGNGHRSVFLDFDPADGIPAGRDWEQELYGRLRACRACIVLCSEHSMASPWCFAEITHAKALGKYVIPVRIAPCTINPILMSRQVLDLTADVEEGYGRLFAALRNAGLDPQDSFDWDGSRQPYPGLMSFDVRDAAVYFGRDDAIQDGLDALGRMRQFGRHRLLMVLGASGSGKSSFVRAGLLPRLQGDHERWLIVPPLRPLNRPFQELALVLARAFAEHGVERGWREIHDALETPAAPGAGVGPILAGIATDLRAAAGQPQAAVLLIVDQFEELFAPGDTADAFFTMLAQVQHDAGSGLVTIGTMRSDFLSEFQRRQQLAPLEYEAMHLGSISVDAFVRVIEGPAEVTGLRLGPGLTQALIDDTDSPDALPLLAFTLRELYDRHGGDGLLTLEEYRNGLGSLERGVARTADAVLASQPLNETEEKALRAAFLSLVRINDEGQYARQIARWSDLPASVHDWLERFVDVRLLVSRTDKGERVLEVAHEALFRSWARLSTWLSEEREFLLWRKRLRASQAEWERTGCDDSALPRGAILAEASRWLELAPDELTASEQDHIRAGLERQAGEEQRWKELFEEADRQRRAAVEAEHRATEALADARARELVLYAEATIESDPQLSLLLGIEAAEHARRTDGTAMPSALSLLRRAILATPGRLAAGVGGIECLAINPARSSIAIGTQSDGVLEVSLDDGEIIRQFATSEWVDTVDFTSDGALIAAGTRDSRVRVWEVWSGTERDSLKFKFHPQSVHWRTGTRQIAVGLANGNASPTKVVDFESGRERFEIRGIRAAWSPDGTLLASGGGDGTVFVYTNEGRALAEMKGHSRYIHKVAWRPDGRWFATASVDDEVIVWDAVEHRELARLENEFALSAAWSSDGSLLGSGGGHRFVTVWDPTTFERVFRLTSSETITGQTIRGSGAVGYVLDVAWTPDGRTFLVSDRDGGVLVYSAGLFTSRTDDDWLATARAQLQRLLTVDERERLGFAAGADALPAAARAEAFTASP